MSPEYVSRQVLFLAITVGLAIIGAALLFIYFQPSIRKRIRNWWLPLSVCGFIFTRPVLYYLVYFASGRGEIKGDVVWWQLEGLSALAGKMPYRDFTCMYSPLFPYLMAIPYGLWHHITSGILLFMVFDLLCLVMLYKLTSMILDTDCGKDIVLLNMLNPIMWLITVRYGQDECIIAFFILAAVYAHMRKNDRVTPIVMALGIMFTKITSSVAMFAIYTYSSKKVRDALLIIGLMLVMYIPFYSAGIHLLDPFIRQSKAIEGLSITAFINDIILPSSARLFLQRVSSVLTVAMVAVILYMAHRRKVNIMECIVITMMTFDLLAPVSYKMYRYWFLGPLSIYSIRTDQVRKFILYSALLAVFEDFFLHPGFPAYAHYPMAVVALAIFYIEISYIVGMLKAGPASEAAKANLPAHTESPALAGNLGAGS